MQKRGEEWRKEEANAGVQGEELLDITREEVHYGVGSTGAARLEGKGGSVHHTSSSPDLGERRAIWCGAIEKEEGAAVQHAGMRPTELVFGCQ